MVQHEIARAQAAARGAQLRDAAHEHDWAGQHDMSTPARVTCPTCGSNTTGGRFCGACGTALHMPSQCRGCGHEVRTGSAFCSNCGQAQ
ncbi:double zinc ribbon domain-containing protein [Nocardia arizonensis]|uniref:double zinc ribbon domain-containing protein n=1 Tax=Nocardia arizonensis TaxID=1141647 RepID=UPI0006D2A46F|nr:zinc ribbon domain-containing protein [Nocardia arizonensis]